MDTASQLLENAASNLLTTFSVLLAFFGFFSALYLLREWSRSTHIIFKIFIGLIFAAVTAIGVSEIFLLQRSSLRAVSILGVPLSFFLQAAIVVMFSGGAFVVYRAMSFWR